MPISISTIVMGTHLVAAVADRIPTFDIARSCKLDTADTPALQVLRPTKTAWTMKTMPENN